MVHILKTDAKYMDKRYTITEGHFFRSSKKNTKKKFFFENLRSFFSG